MTKTDKQREQLLDHLKKQPTDPFFDVLNRYGEHMASCPNCNPALGKLCDQGSEFAANVVEFYSTNHPPGEKP
jgi:hypothetical protein